MRQATLAAVLLLAISPLLAAQEESAPATSGLTFHRAPKPLAEGAIVEAWPSFRGPRRDGISNERPLASTFSEGGPALVWELERGESMASPAIADGRLVHTHRVNGQVHIDCLAPETGERLWRHSFPCDYAGRYFDNNGPRATPTIADGRVVVHGVGGLLICLDLATGEPLWQHDTTAERGAGDGFFGVVSTPLVVGDLVVQNVGAPGASSVVAFDLATGKRRWGVGDKWGASCASPVLGTIAGKPRILVVTGGESRPSTGGLLIVSPAGELTCEYVFRSRTYTSVNGPSPVVFGDSVFLTASYALGSAAVDIDENGAGTERWKNRRGLALEFSTPVFIDGVLVAVDGTSGRAGALVAVDPATGEQTSRKQLEFDQTIVVGEGSRTISTSIGNGSLVHADGVYWVLGDTGQLVTATLGDDGFEVIAQAPLFHASETWTPPVIAGGLLYVCQNNTSRVDGKSPRLLCYDVRGD